MNTKQKQILELLVITNGLRYSELGRSFSIDDKFPYHLKYLTNQGYINKRDKAYYITKAGVKATSVFDRQTLTDIDTPSLMLVLICQYKNMFFLKKHFGDDSKRSPFLCIPTGRAHVGRSLEDSCTREAHRKYKLSVPNFRYIATFHLTHFATDKDILFDTVHLAFRANVSESDYVATKDSNQWLAEAEIAKFANISPLVQRLILNEESGYIQDSFEYNYGFALQDINSDNTP